MNQQDTELVYQPLSNTLKRRYVLLERELRRRGCSVNLTEYSGINKMGLVGRSFVAFCTLSNTKVTLKLL
jgi:hypothetical protein